MNSKNHLRSFGAAFRGVFIFLLVVSVFSAPTPTRAAGGQDLIVTKSPVGGNFIPLENGRAYTITVRNQGSEDTDGSDVIVVDSLNSLPARPDGAPELVATNISGDGWTCTLATLTCNRTTPAPLLAGDSYPPITVTVNVLLEARNPLNNKATVSGGGELPAFTSNNESVETIPVDAKADLVILSYEIRDLATHAVITSPAADQAFYIRVKVKNQGGAGTASVFYTGAYLDNKPNYGDEVPFGTVTKWSDFYSSQGLGGNNTGCLYYDPAPLIDESVTSIDPNWGNYTRANLNSALDPGTTEDVDIKFEYPQAQYSDPAYTNLNIRSGLKAGTYTINLFADPTCQVVEMNEGKTSNNVYGPINLTVTGEVGCNPPVGGAQVFEDVPLDYWARDYIEAMYYCGYTAGCSTSGPLLFCPDTVMNRAQSAVFLLRSRYGGSYTPPAPPYTTFSDNFSPGPWAEPWAQGLYNAGMTAGCATTPFLIFCPWEPATQAQLAVFGMRMKFGDALPLPTPTGTVFADMPISHWATGWAEQAYANDLILPCGTQGGLPLFCPDSLVSRASASYTIVKAKNLLP